jgi:anti-anti-sigma factor
MPDPSFPVELMTGLPVVVAPEEIDISNAGGLRAALLEAARSGRTVVVDLSQTEFCDSAGLNVLVRAYQRAEADGGDLRLVITRAPVLRLLSVTGLRQVIPYYDSLEQALEPVFDRADEHYRVAAD